MNATQVRLLYYLLAGLLLLGLIYQLLPILACQLDLRLAATWRLQRISLRRGWQKILPRPLHQWLSRRLLQAGFRDSDHLGRYLLALALPAPVLALGARLMAGDARNGFLAGLLLAALCNQWVGQRIKQRRNAFHLCLYKIYRFLDLQLTAGIKATDVLKGLSEAVTDPAIKPDFQRFCASFELTLDLDQALQELDSAFHSSDLTLLSSQLRQCLQTGIVAGPSCGWKN